MNQTQNQVQTQNHNSLYRKYRPYTFDDVMGQDKVVQSLKNTIEKNKPHHAYIFVGDRGIGKTTIARIFARDLKVNHEDIYEIDAASHNGVENIREITESSMMLPLSSPYKIFILDEIHMLSKAAFNAFLKTLEEPPRHVIFMMATTEIHKVPDTIISRSEVYNLEKPDMNTLIKLIKKVSKDEEYQMDDESAKLIARHGDYSFRNTLGVLQKVITNITNISKKDINIDDTVKVLGIDIDNDIDNILNNYIKNDIKSILNIIDNLEKKGIDSEVFYNMILEKIRDKLRINDDKILFKLLSLMVQNHKYIKTVNSFSVFESLLNN